MNYDDIIHLPHHTSSKRVRMPAENRAAQFAPFAALTGHEDAIAETARLTDSMTEWDPDIMALINLRLTEALQQRKRVTFTYFVADRKKEGGAYHSATGMIKRIDEVSRTLFLEDGTAIPLSTLCDVSE